MLIKSAEAQAEGHVTAAGYRVMEGTAVALALLRDGAARHGEEFTASSPTRNKHVRVRVTGPHFYDHSGDRYRD